MQRNTLLLIMVAAGSAMCWWPTILAPDLDFLGWKFPLILIALITGLGTALSSEGGGLFMVVSLLSGVAGIFCGFWLWWPADLVDVDVPLLFYLGLPTLISLPVSIMAAFAGVALRDSRIATKNRRLLWAAFLVSLAIAPTAVVLKLVSASLRK